jgi:hypothetical protein
MKNISDLFTDEEKKQLSCLGSTLRRKPTQEEEEFEEMVDAWIKARKMVKPQGPARQGKTTQDEEAEG